MEAQNFGKGQPNNMRGQKNGTEPISTPGFEFALGYLHRRVEEYIESIAGQDAFLQMEFTSRLAELLSHKGQWHEHRMPLRIQAREGRSQSSTLESSIQPYGGRSQHTTNKGTGKAATNQVKNTWYSKLSKKEQLEVTLARLKKRKDEKGKKMYKSVLAKSKGKDSPTKQKRDIAKQHIYAARNRARHKGLPLPPLPKEDAAA
jgi:hypothetical protein